MCTKWTPSSPFSTDSSLGLPAETYWTFLSARLRYHVSSCPQRHTQDCYVDAEKRHHTCRCRSKFKPAGIRWAHCAHVDLLLGQGTCWSCNMPYGLLNCNFRSLVVTVMHSVKGGRYEMSLSILSETESSWDFQKLIILREKIESGGFIFSWTGSSAPVLVKSVSQLGLWQLDGGLVFNRKVVFCCSFKICTLMKYWSSVGSWDLLFSTTFND